MDVTEFFTGGINEDIVFSGTDGVAFSTKATPGTVWTRVVRTSRGLVMHLINLVGQDDVTWDAGKNDPPPQHGITLRLAPVAGPPTLVWATPDADGGAPRELNGRAEGVGSQHDALSAGQTYALYNLPAVTTWAIVLLPANAL